MLKGSCACGAVRFELDRDPDVQLYCHCEDCLRVSGCPVRESIVWVDVADGMAEATDVSLQVLRITEGRAHVQKHNRTPVSNRYFCMNCGNHLYLYINPSRIISIPPINIDGFVFNPTMHIFCADAKRGSMAAYINDGLPKYKVLPALFGGTSELIDTT